MAGLPEAALYYGCSSATPVLTFSPASLTINAGDTVTFSYVGTPSGSGAVAHNVASDTAGLFRCANGCDGDGAGGNGNPNAGAWTATVTFNTPGTFGYHCENHQSMGMVGSITVNAVVVTPPPFAITPGLTGTWYNTDQSGHGFNIEVLANNVIVAIWYVFDATGNNLWLTGVGNYSGNTATLNVTQISGGLFPPNFDPTKIVRNPWGTLMLTFTDCNDGSVSWVPVDMTNFSSGSLTIGRLTSVGGLACPRDGVPPNEFARAPAG